MHRAPISNDLGWINVILQQVDATQRHFGEDEVSIGFVACYENSPSQKYTKVISIAFLQHNLSLKSLDTMTIMGFDLPENPIGHSTTTLTFLLHFNKTKFSEQRFKVLESKIA
jgi:hypothetical protein